MPDIRLELSAPIFAASPCNLAGIAYRAHRCSGCGWTEQLRHNGLWIASASLFHPAGFSASPRLRPLCLQAPGTPRHLRWVCPGGLGVDLVVFRKDWLRAVEEFLLRWTSLPVLLRAGETWVAASGFRRACLSSPFPVLHAWGLSPCPVRDSLIAADGRTLRWEPCGMSCSGGGSRRRWVNLLMLGGTRCPPLWLLVQIIDVVVRPPFVLRPF